MIFEPTMTSADSSVLGALAGASYRSRIGRVAPNLRRVAVLILCSTPPLSSLFQPTPANMGLFDKSLQQ
jgi:hypothetical protein